MNQDVANFLWVNGRLSLYESKCIESFLAKGFRVHVYSYEDIVIPTGAVLKDAREVLPESEVFTYTQEGKKGNLAAFSDAFRYEIVKKGLGWWFDADVFCLKDVKAWVDLASQKSVVLAWEDDLLINGAVMYVNDENFHELIAKKLKIAGKKFQWGEIGPRMITEVIKELGMENEVLNKSSFYPVHWTQFNKLLDESDKGVCEQLSQESFSLHLWNEFFTLYAIPKELYPPEGSFLDSLFFSSEEDKITQYLSKKTLDQLIKAHELSVKYQIIDQVSQSRIFRLLLRWHALQKILSRGIRKARVALRNILIDNNPLNGLIKDPKTVYVLSYEGLTNIGDEIQAIASRELIEKLGYNVKYTNRENLVSHFSIFKRRILMNGWFSHSIHSFPPSKSLHPVFIGFHLANRKLLEHKDYFKKHEPIGCRDVDTVDIFEAAGVKSYFTGCPTSTLERRETEQENDCLVVDAHLDNPDGHTSDARRLLEKVLDRYMIKDYIFHTQNCDVNLNNEQKTDLAKSRLLDLCKSNLVITNRLHIALPCLAMDVPVIFVHADPYSDSRLSTYVDYFWYCTNNKSDLPEVGDYKQIKNKDLYKKIAEKIRNKYKESLEDDF